MLLAATWGAGVGTGVAAEVGADEPREGRGVGRAEYVGRPVGRAVDGWGDPVGARLSVGYDVVGLGVGSFDGRDVGADDGAHVPTAPRATRAPRRRLETSPVGRQVSSRLRSGSAFTFYGPAGAAYDPQKSHKVVKFGGPHAKVSTLSPGPAKYDPSQIALHQVSTQRRAPSSHIFSRQSAWNAEQVRRLNRHRARQQDLPSAGDLHTMALETKILQKQYPRCHFARQSTHRPFFTPLENSARFMGAITKQRERALALRAERVRKARAAAGLEAP